MPPSVSREERWRWELAIKGEEGDRKGIQEMVQKTQASRPA